jgi:hypothetical protein
LAVGFPRTRLLTRLLTRLSEAILPVAKAKGQSLDSGNMSRTHSEIIKNYKDSLYYILKNQPIKTI